MLGKPNTYKLIHTTFHIFRSLNRRDWCSWSGIKEKDNRWFSCVEDLQMSTTTPKFLSWTTITSQSNEVNHPHKKSALSLGCEFSSKWNSKQSGLMPASQLEFEPLLEHLYVTQNLPSISYLFMWLAGYCTGRALPSAHSQVAVVDSLQCFENRIGGMAGSRGN